MNMLKAVFQFIWKVRRRERTTAQLLQLDDDQLADIGVNRGQVLDCARAERRKVLDDKNTMSCG